MADLPRLVGAGRPARGERHPGHPGPPPPAKATGGAVEVLLAERTGDGEWTALVRPGRRVPPGTVLLARRRRGRRGRRRSWATASAAVRLLGDEDPLALVHRLGSLPLPPYITTSPRRSRALPDGLRPPARVGRRAHRRACTSPTRSSTAARGRGAGGRDRPRGRARHLRPDPGRAGRGPRRPHRAVRHPRGDRATRSAGAERVIAVGTTVVRALESWPPTGAAGGHAPTSSSVGGHRFATVDVLLTNFHVPRSSACWSWSTPSSVTAGGTSTPSPSTGATASSRSATPCSWSAS